MLPEPRAEPPLPPNSASRRSWPVLVPAPPFPQFKRVLNRELIHLSETSGSRNQVSKYISRTFLGELRRKKGYFRVDGA